MRLIDADSLEIELLDIDYYGFEVWGVSEENIKNAPTVTQPPNEPLTLVELREMDGEPVRVSWSGHSSEGWALVRVWSKPDGVIYLTYNNGVTDLVAFILDYGAKIYRCKPEEVKT